MKKLTKKYLLIVATLLFGVITCIHPVYPTEQFLQHLGTLALLFIPIYDLRQNKLSLTAYACVIAFTFVHIIGQGIFILTFLITIGLNLFLMSI